MKISLQVNVLNSASTGAASYSLDKADESPNASTPPPTAVQAAGVRVSLSEAGIQKSADAQHPRSNDDIDTSGLPDQTQKTIKMIRDLEQKIEQKQQELDRLMGNQNMDPDLKKSQLGALASEISSLTAGLATANNALVKQSRSGKLSADQLQQAQQLAAR